MQQLRILSFLVGDREWPMTIER